MKIPAFRTRQIQRVEPPITHLSFASAIDLVSRLHRRIDSVRWQLFQSMKELEKIKVQLEMGQGILPPHPRRPRRARSSPRPTAPQGSLFVNHPQLQTKEEKHAGFHEHP